MIFDIPDDTLRFGFRKGSSGAHGNRTMMLEELSRLIAASQPGDSTECLRHLAVDENAILKQTVANRREVFTRLSGLYALDTACLLWRVLRDLWDVAPDDRAVLALLCALARDPLLRATATVVCETPIGEPVTAKQLETALMDSFGATRNQTSAASTSRHAISSWAQSGLLNGRSPKIRTTIQPGPAAAAYALLLGHLCGVRGSFLFGTPWTTVLGVTESSIDSLAFTASQRGWLEYRRIGDVTEITFRRWLGEGR